MGTGIYGKIANTYGASEDLPEQDSKSHDYMQHNSSSQSNPSKVTVSSLSVNILAIIGTYPLRMGYFGSSGSSSRVRRIASDDPEKTAADFAEKISKGAKKKWLNNGGYIATLDDGTFITYRPVSHSDKSPAISINTKNVRNSDIKSQKIHFSKRRHK